MEVARLSPGHCPASNLHCAPARCLHDSFNAHAKRRAINQEAKEVPGDLCVRFQTTKNAHLIQPQELSPDFTGVTPVTPVTGQGYQLNVAHLPLLAFSTFCSNFNGQPLVTIRQFSRRTASRKVLLLYALSLQSPLVWRVFSGASLVGSPY